MNLKTEAENKNQLEESLKILADTRVTVRNISHDLMPPVFQYESINEMLSDYTAHIDKPDKMEIMYSAANNIPWTEVPQAVSYEIYRVVQELLSNGIKHSEASKVEVMLILKDNLLQAKVSDNGIGFDKNRNYKGIGLHTMAERIKSIGGELNIIAGDEGTRVSASVKIK